MPCLPCPSPKAFSKSDEINEDGGVFRLSPEKQLSIVIKASKSGAAGLTVGNGIALSQDGADGEVYVVISGQGRVIVFNRNGLPIM